ncbi:MAG: hypothetical protein H7329_10610, partial [Opitutaceae bacterium]|nr:hypothetical protein [Cytophagales bacterium]
MHIINYSLCKTLGLFFLLNSFYCMDALAQNGVGVNTNTPKSSFEDNGSFGKKVTTINAATTLDETYSTVVCNNLTTAITVTLPVANTCSARIYEIKRNAASTALVTINVTSGGTIDGVTSFLLSKAGQSITIFSDGSTWISRDGSGDGSNWALTGNAGTTAGTNFLGTTDVQDLVFKTNGSEGARLTSATPSAFGVGTTTPITYGRLAVVSNSVGSGRQDDLGIASFNASPSPSLLFFSAKGTEGAQTDLAAGDDIFSIIGKGRIIGATSVNTTTSSIISEYRGTGVAPNSNLSNIGFFTSGSLVAQMMLNEFGKVGIRTTGPVSYL